MRCVCSHISATRAVHVWVLWAPPWDERHETKREKKTVLRKKDANYRDRTGWNWAEYFPLEWARVARASLCERFKGDWCVPAGCNATTYTKSTVLSTYMHADNRKGVVQITQVQRASDSCQWEHVRLRLIIGLSFTCSGTLEGTEGDRKSMGDIERMWEQRI